MNGLRWSIALWALLLAGTHAATQADTVAGSADAAGQAEAPQAPAIKIYKYRDRSGAMSFSDRAPASARYEIIRYSSSCYACNPLSSIDWHGVPLQLNAFRDEIRSAADKYGVDPALVRAVIHAESAFSPRAKSKKGAIGLMQLMPETAKDMGVADVLSPRENILGGVRYLAWLLEKNGGNTLLATAAYNAGPGAVERYNGIPPYEETQTYVKRVRILHNRYRLALADTYRQPQLSQIRAY